ncbi:MAG: JDVT-CTERM domain-containing protein [Rhodoferax sp.]|uniref:JDVT-CTERM domain-containing protein n=1 Tax=Rhodoferax sp. TaxID=50421 RepID=UPI0026141C20|nr:JDVT-CTERM domain-containing protein [Rhodoferax sp.]MDD2878926.1 JDVT-CTERM domain-containing protein [Rhodoferax sp.]
MTIRICIGVAAEEASLAMTPAGDTLYSVWAQQADGVHEARFARVWYDDTNFTATTPAFSYVAPKKTVLTAAMVNEKDDAGGGCSAATAERPVDPMLPLLAALGLIGWGVRRTRRS